MTYIFSNICDLIDPWIEEVGDLTERHGQYFVDPVHFIIQLSVGHQLEGWSFHGGKHVERQQLKAIWQNKLRR